MIQLLLAILLLAIPCTSLAALPSQLEQDFAPLDGYVVMPMGNDDFLIDLDASKGVRTGDIFSIIRKGEAITHPVTGAIIGNLESNNTFLQVTRPKTGYSYAHKVGGDAEPKKGDQIKRFDSVPAQFIDNTSDSHELKADLQSRLPGLDWLEAQSDLSPLLIFERNANALRVKSADDSTLFSYPLEPKTVTTIQTVSPALTLATTPAATVTTASAPQTQGIIQNQSDTSKIWHGATHKDEVLGLRIDDFNNDGLQETALLLQKKLIISSYSGTNITNITEVSLKGALSPLAIDSIDLNGNGRAEIFLSAVRDGVPASRVYELTDKKLTEIARDLPILFRRIDHPQKGALLLGQKRHDRKIPFSGKPFQVVFSDDTYKEGVAYSVPSRANIYSSIPLATENSDIHSVYLNNSDFLKIQTAAGEDLFESPDRFGGSETMLQLQPEASDDIAKRYFLPQRLIVTNGELLAVQNDGSRVVQNWRKFTKSRIVSLKWNGLSLDENWRTSDQSGQTADFAVADIDNDGQAELVLAVKFARKGLFTSAKSTIIVYELK